MGHMSVFLFCIAILSFIALVFVAAIQPTRTTMSQFELRRRAKKNDLDARRILEREEKLRDIETVISVTKVVLFILVITLLLLSLGLFFGFILSVIVGLTYTKVAHTVFVVSTTRQFYEKYEPVFLTNINTLVPILKPFRVHVVPAVDRFRRFDSRQELQFSIQQSKTVLSEDERALIVASLAFKDRTVNEIMTPRTVMTTIHKDEFLGPLVLSELHDSGHSRLPVIAEDLNHVVGMLHVRDLLSLNNKHSATAEKVMEKKVFYIHHEDTLEHALAAFIKTRHHLFIVINEQRETVGLLSLEDVLETLIGRAIVDEDDNHADLRAVALQKGKSNNAAAGHVDL
jgi:CBS domain containing-hemolysin-like protein